MCKVLSLVAALVLVAMVDTTPAGAGVAASCPAVVAHRTAMTTAPENTVRGIQAAAGTGATAVEMDVQFSASSFPILMHDPTVDRTTNGTGQPANLSLSYLTGLLAQDYPPWRTDPRFAGTHVPYGWDYMDASSGAGLDVLLDMHAQPSHPAADKLVHYIDVFGWNDHTTVMGNASTVTALKGWYPSTHTMLIEYPPTDAVRSGEYLRSLNVDGYAVFHTGVTPAAVAYWHTYGLTVYTWTSDVAAQDVPTTWAGLASAGVDAIITNDPAGLTAWETTSC